MGGSLANRGGQHQPPLHIALRIPYPAAMSDWQSRLWSEVIPHLPAGRVALWAEANALPIELPTPPETLLVRSALSTEKPPKGTAFNALVVIAAGTPALPWEEFLQALAPLAAPQAPLLLLTPRGGLVGFNKGGWQPTLPPRVWEETLRNAGWGAFSTAYLGGLSWPSPWASAACRLYVAQRRGGGGMRVQFKRKASAEVATSANAPLPC